MFASSASAMVLAACSPSLTESLDGILSGSLDRNPEVNDDDSKNIVYLDVDVNNNRGRILISLNNKVTPKTCKNFSVLCEKKAYVNSPFHRVIKEKCNRIII